MKHRWSEEDLKRVKEKKTTRAGDNPGQELARASSGVSAAPSYKSKLEAAFAFTLPTQIPSGKNAVLVTRTGQRYPNKRFKVWRDAAIKCLPSERPSFAGPVRVIVKYTPGDNIRRDVPGMLDALCHLIEKVGVVHDDAQVKNISWTTFPPCKGKPTCDVSITELCRKV